MTRPINQIAADIRQAWPKPYFGAVPYLNAMRQLTTIDGKFYEDSAKEIVIYFLANASTFRGEQARVLKAELKKLAGIK